MALFTIPCLIFKQRDDNGPSPKFALFAAPAGEIEQWAAIRRRTEVEGGTQRALNRAKLTALKRFLEKDARNTIPPAITVTLKIDDQSITFIDLARPETRTMCVITLAVPDGAADPDKPGLIIDGQHRLFGIKEFNPACLVNVVALLNVDDLETAFQFLVINNKVTPIAPDLIRTLALDYQEEALAERLKTARLTLHKNLPYVGIMDSDESSPFRGIIGLITHEGEQGPRFVPPAAIENAIAMIQKKDVRELESEDALCEFFYAIWSPIKDQWNDVWNPTSYLMTKVGIVSMTMFVTDALVAKYDWGDLDVTDPSKVREEVQRVLNLQTSELWKNDWTMKINDSVVVREKIIESLTKISRNIRADKPWNEDVDLVTL